MDEYAPQEVKAIFEKLVGYRERVVRQVAGIPAASMNAILEKASPEYRAGYEPLPEPESRFMKWLESRAQTGFMAHVVYSLTDRCKKMRENEEKHLLIEREGAQLDRASAQVVYEQTQAATRMQPEEAQFLTVADTEMLAFMAKQGQLAGIPEVVNEQLRRSSHGPRAVTVPGSRGYITMAGNRSGDIFGTTIPDFEPNRSGHEVGRQIRSIEQLLNQPGGIEGLDHRKAIYTRWMILLHEAAHVEFAQVNNPFRPANNAIDPAAVQAFNRWNPAYINASSSAFSSAAMNEMYADARGAMMLLEATGYDPVAMEAIQDFADLRRSRRERGDRLNREKLQEDGTLGGNFFVLHATEWTLEQVMDNVAHWAAQTPDQMRETALGYASKGIMEFANPDRIGPDGTSIGRDYLENMIGPEICANAAKITLGKMIMLRAAGQDPVASMERMKLDPTVVDLARKSWMAVQDRVDEALDATVSTDSGGSFKMADLILRYPEAPPCSAMRNTIIEDPALPVNNQGCQEYKAMQAAYERDLPLMYKAFGATPPSITASRLDQWRKVRYQHEGGNHVAPKGP